MKNLVFWLCVLIGGVALQRTLQGVDVLAAGLILALQRESPGTVAAIVAAMVLVQEGAGSLAFGAGLLIYGLLIGGFWAGRQVFAPGSVLFVGILCMWHGLVISSSVHLLAGLQDLTLPPRAALPFLLGQASVLFVVWAVLRWLHPAPEANNVTSI